MDKHMKWMRSYLPTRRRLIQLYTALLYNAHIKGFINGNIYTGSCKMICVPGFNCYSCPGAIGACPLGALQNAVASSGSRAPTYVLGILLLYGLILGRTICGFLCPVGLAQELLHKIPTPKLKKGRITRVLSYLKYVVLGIFVILIPLWYAVQNYPVPAFCKYICPAGTFEGAIGLLANPVNADKYSMLGLLFTRKFVIMMITIGICVFVFRAFCRFLCPLGAIYGLFAKIAIIGVKVDLLRCIDCGRCVSQCKMDIHRVGDHECIHCGECISICPTKAISFKAGKYTLQSPDSSGSFDKRKALSVKGIIAWVFALILLIAALVYFNQANEAISNTNIPVAETTETHDNDIALNNTTIPPIGNAVGMRAPDFSVPVYGSDIPFVLSEQLGKKVIINFWATWCAPCCKELPYFDEIHRKYGNVVSVIAIHSDLVTDDVEGYLANYGYEMPFALDATGEIIKSFDGSTMLPHTVIVDEQGVIAYNAVGSLTLEKLEMLLNDVSAISPMPER